MQLEGESPVALVSTAPIIYVSLDTTAAADSRRRRLELDRFGMEGRAVEASAIE